LAALSNRPGSPPTLKTKLNPNRTKSMKTYSFKVILEPDEDSDGILPAVTPSARRLSVCGGSTFGESREAALKNINEVVPMIVQEPHRRLRKS
jgi:hypothetical protein